MILFSLSYGLNVYSSNKIINSWMLCTLIKTCQCNMELNTKLQVSKHTKYIINITTQGANWNNND